jgi:hypothetical protein
MARPGLEPGTPRFSGTPSSAQTRSKWPANRRSGVGRLVPDAFALGWVSACLGLRGRAEVPKLRHQARQLESAGVRPGPTTRWRPVLLRPVTGRVAASRLRTHEARPPSSCRSSRSATRSHDTTPRRPHTSGLRSRLNAATWARRPEAPPGGIDDRNTNPNQTQLPLRGPLVREGHIAHQLITRARRTPMLVRHRLRARCHRLFCSVTQAAVAAGDGSLRASAWAAAAAR